MITEEEQIKHIKRVKRMNKRIIKMEGFLWLLFILVLGCLLIQFVNAASTENETYTGTLGYEGYNVTSLTGGTYSTGGNKQIIGFYTSNIENVGNFKSATISASSAACGITLNASYTEAGYTTPVTFRIYNNTIGGDGLPIQKDGQIIGTGTFGLQRIYNTAIPPTCQGYYLWAVANSWNVTSNLTGIKRIYFDMNRTAIGSPTVMFIQGYVGVTPTTITFDAGGGSPIMEPAPWYLSNMRDISTRAQYSISYSPNEGLIFGNMTKTIGLSQGIIYSAAGSGSVLASQTTNTLSPFNFTVLPTAVKLGLKDPLGNIYNSSVFFSYLNPNVTPTVTQTYDPTGLRIKIITQDGLNNTPVNGVALGLYDLTDSTKGWNNVTMSSNSNEYTFGGYGTNGATPFVRGHSYAVSYTKTGYDTLYKNYGPYESTNQWTIYENLYSTSYKPGTFTFTLRIPMYNKNTNHLVGATSGSVKLYNQSSIYNITVLNPNDAASFCGLIPSHTYRYDIMLSGYEPYSDTFVSQMGMNGSYQQSNAYLTPTDLPPSPYSISVNPTSGTKNDTYILTLTGDLSTAKRVQYTYYNQETAASTFISGSGRTDYRLVTGSWMQWDGSSYSIPSSVPQSVNAKFDYTQESDRTFTIIAYITSNTDVVYTAQTTVSIVSQGMKYVSIIAEDGDSPIGARISTFNSYIFDLSEGRWYNTSYDTSTFSYAYLYAPIGTTLQYYGTANGYMQTPTHTMTVQATGVNEVKYIFYQNKVPPTVENVTLYANVRNTAGNGISLAQVVFSDNQRCYTNTIGTCGVTVLNGVYYSATASAYGYGSGTGGLTTSNTTSNIINIVLVGSTPTPTNIVPTTPQINPTYTNWSINQSTFEEQTCITDTRGLSMMQIYYNWIACTGVRGATNQGLIAALGIMLICGMVLARYGKGAGALAGVIAGAGISLGLGMIPFWICIFVLVVCGLVFATLITREGK